MVSISSTSNGLGIEGHWIGIHDGDPRAVTLYRRHYSAPRLGRLRYHANQRKFCGPGAHMVLLTSDGLGLFVWRLNLIRQDGQLGMECSVFRNEGPLRSSDLILEAEELAWCRWPGQRLFTYVWPAKVKSINPGYCFKCAGWRQCGRNKDGRLIILEKLAPLS